jgi:hypothetical protein
MKIERYPVAPDTIEVLGHKVKATDAAWTGLDWSRVVSAEKTRLRVLWCHPDDQTGSPDDFDCVYAIYPRAEPGKRWRRRMVDDVWFEFDDGRWFVTVLHS